MGGDNDDGDGYGEEMEVRRGVQDKTCCLNGGLFNYIILYFTWKHSSKPKKNTRSQRCPLVFS